MIEDEARHWLAANHDVSRETWSALDGFVSFLRDEATRQNLISASTIDAIWARHVVDSAQLISHGQGPTWLDLGSGAGFPGLIIAALTPYRVTLVESRRKRVAFLEAAAEILGVKITIIASRLETMATTSFATISARAFAPLDRLLPLAHRFSRPDTIWVLPKGRNAQAELEAASGSWQGVFGIEASVTDPDAGIIVASKVRPAK